MKASIPSNPSLDLSVSQEAPDDPIPFVPAFDLLESSHADVSDDISQGISQGPSDRDIALIATTLFELVPFSGARESTWVTDARMRSLRPVDVRRN